VKRDVSTFWALAAFIVGTCTNNDEHLQICVHPLPKYFFLGGLFR
jgi:hypothetical protein